MWTKKRLRGLTFIEKSKGAGPGAGYQNAGPGRHRSSVLQKLTHQLRCFLFFLGGGGHHYFVDGEIPLFQLGGLLKTLAPVFWWNKDRDDNDLYWIWTRRVKWNPISVNQLNHHTSMASETWPIVFLKEKCRKRKRLDLGIPHSSLWWLGWCLVKKSSRLLLP